jgi:hypothetical protein
MKKLWWWRKAGNQGHDSTGDESTGCGWHRSRDSDTGPTVDYYASTTGRRRKKKNYEDQRENATNEESTKLTSP